MYQPRSLLKISLSSVRKHNIPANDLPVCLQDKLKLQECCEGFDSDFDYIQLIMHAFYNDHPMCLKLLCDKYKYNKSALCNAAAYHGSLKCLEFLIKNKFFFDKTTINFAVIGGCLQCLKLLHKYNCQWDSSLYDNAIIHDRVACFKYAYKKHCPLDKDACIEQAIIYNRYELYDFLTSL